MHKVLTEEPKRLGMTNPETPRDIETICLKCLEKEPTRRYSSADALADDLSRWLRHEPIVARSASVWAKASKWARRNPVASVLSALLLLTFVTGAGGTFWELAQSKRALRESEVARRMLKDTLRSLGRSVDLPMQRGFLEASTVHLEEQLKLHPELEADFSEALGTIYCSLGDFPRAEAKLRKALVAYSRESGTGPRDVGLCLNTLGVVVQRHGNRGEAEPIYRESLRILTEALGPESVDLDEPRDNLAFVLRRLSKFSESEALYREAWEITQRRFGKDSWQAAERVAPVVQVMLQQRKPQEAEPLAREALETLIESRPQDWQRFELESLLGGCLSDQKKFDRAEEFLLNGYKGLWDSGVTNFFVGRMKIGEALDRLARHFEAAGPPEKAAEWKRSFEEWNKVIEEYNAAAATPAGRSPH